MHVDKFSYESTVHILNDWKIPTRLVGNTLYVFYP